MNEKSSPQAYDKRHRGQAYREEVGFAKPYCHIVNHMSEKGHACQHAQYLLEWCDAICSSGDLATVAEWYRYRIVACFVTSSIPVPLKTRREGQRCTLNLSRAESSSRWCGVVVRRGGASSGVVHVT
ncbi:uncharacterized protein TNCV_1930251 [Trichonephila clavipes]|nr:uncharacterized protein TNCV_1930251 [Trichonephila clavipes]